MSNWLTRLNSEHSFLILRLMQIASMTIFQLVFPVLFISGFGITSYGKWVITISIVSFLGFLDFGLFNSVINDAIAFRSVGQDESAKKLLYALAKFILYTSFALTVMIPIMVFVVPFHIESNTLIATLAFGVILQVLIRLNESISRAYLNASGFAVLVTSYIVESTLLALAVYSEFEFVKIATLLVCSRSMFVTVGFFLNRKYLSPLKVIRPNFEEITIFETKRSQRLRIFKFTNRLSCSFRFFKCDIGLCNFERICSRIELTAHFDWDYTPVFKRYFDELLTSGE